LTAQGGDKNAELLTLLATGQEGDMKKEQDEKEEKTNKNEQDEKEEETKKRERRDKMTPEEKEQDKEEERHKVLNNKRAAKALAYKEREERKTYADFLAAESGINTSVLDKFLTTDAATGKWKVNWNGLAEEHLAGLEMETATRCKEFLAHIASGWEVQEGMEHEFWGENWESKEGGKAKTRLKNHLKTFVPMAFTLNGGVEERKGLPKGVKVLPQLLAHNTARFAKVAKEAFMKATKEGEGLLNWSHAAEHSPFGSKMIFKVFLSVCLSLSICLFVRLYSSRESQCLSPYIPT
jgi:hypothetical protein